MDVDRCSEWRELASCRLDGELDELQAARLERHLLDCEPCRSWTREIAALATVFHDSIAECPVGSSELRTHALRRRLVRSATAASAASAAAVAAFVIAVPGTIALFSHDRTAVSAAPCTSCMKKQALTFDGPPSSSTAVAPVHVAHPPASQ
ncbi:MAG TPA: zf-HC2 domain-containing protein [Gaiellaceae bacterium]|nr:zf-HC2 domain-containing protein [Gaiellaceae bacterium]